MSDPQQDLDGHSSLKSPQVVPHSDLEFNSSYSPYPEVVPYVAPYKSSDSSSPGKRNPLRIILFLTSFIVVAVIAAVIGGVVGKKVEHDSCTTSASHLAQLQKESASASQCAVTVSAKPTPASAFSAASATSSIAPSTATATAIAIPSTGCPDNANQTLTSDLADVKYKMRCSTNWIGYDIVATTAETMSNCVEACWSLNHYAASDSGDKNNCTAVTWVPGWVNTTVAWNAVKIPGNCYLKYKTVGFPATDPSGGEVVGASLL